MTKDDRYLIWSFEHDAWWAPHERGYVRDWREAGVYTREKAAAIVDGANYVPGVLNETFIPISAIEPRESR